MVLCISVLAMRKKKCVVGLILLSVTLRSHFYVTPCSHMFEEHIVNIFVLILLFAYVLQLRVSPYSWEMLHFTGIDESKFFWVAALACVCVCGSLFFFFFLQGSTFRFDTHAQWNFLYAIPLSPYDFRIILRIMFGFYVNSLRFPQQYYR